MTIIESVKNYYGKVLSSQKDLKTSACLVSKKCFANAALRSKFKLIPTEVNDKFYGCGLPLPDGIQGLTVVDLGCGSGRDCYLASLMVGDTGKVIGVDMTEEQLDVAKRNVSLFEKAIGWKPNLEFHQGYIEYLEDAGIAKESVDLVISNCVINLSPRKDLVLQSVYNVLKEGGEFYFSDVYCDRRLPKAVREHKLLWGECIAGALYFGDFMDIAKRAGFTDIRQCSINDIEVEQEFKEILGNARFYSITFRLFKLQTLETRCEDYGQVAIYKGTIENHRHVYELDEGHLFETGKPVLVCGNTASMLTETYLNSHFEVCGNRKVHYGTFKVLASSQPKSSTQDSAAFGSCCG